MTDVLIKNWCIPECCMDCDPDFAYAIKCKAYNENNDFTRQRAENCPLVEIKHSQDGDTISRADAIEAVRLETGMRGLLGRGDILDILSALPSADANPIVIRSKTLMPTKDFMEWAKRIKGVNPNAVVIPCDAEVASAEAVQGEWELIETYADGYDFMGDRTWAHKYKCPYCGFINIVIENFGQYDFCPNCGARMKGGEQNDD